MKEWLGSLDKVQPLLVGQHKIGHTFFADAAHFMRGELRSAGWRHKHLLWHDM